MVQNKSIYLVPVMLCFFCMGFVDLVGIASNYVKEDLALSDSVANVFPSLVFFFPILFISTLVGTLKMRNQRTPARAARWATVSLSPCSSFT